MKYSERVKITKVNTTITFITHTHRQIDRQTDQHTDAETDR